MLERIAKVQGIGLLHQANGQRYSFRKGTLIYAENGRGKSTLASILRSVGTGNGDLISERVTVDGTLAPEAELRFDSGHRVSFEGGRWSESRPELLVFDADFIERNVHSGGAVNTNHRKSLLEFALGEGAVSARNRVDGATAKLKLAKAEVAAVQGQLSGYHDGVPLVTFTRFSPVDDPDNKIAALRKRLDASTSTAAIMAKPVPVEIHLPSLDFDSLFSILGKSLDNIHEDAERVVQRHVESIGKDHAEHWISLGEEFERDGQCPYCGQELEGVELIRAYRTYFNESYSELKGQVNKLEQGVLIRASDQIIEKFLSGAETAQAQALGWTGFVTVEAIEFGVEEAKALLSQLRELLLGLARSKSMRPTESVGTTTQREEAEALWNCLLEKMHQTNQKIASTSASISAYKQALELENPMLLQRQIRDIELACIRHSDAVVVLFDQLANAQIKSAAAEKKKKDERAILDDLMRQTLSDYEIEINRLLISFGASFTIRDMGANHRGGSPRSEYGLLLRGQPVLVEGGTPSFSTALSEGDKRTLAFAFFVASVLADNRLNEKIVVIDDPMCSLDINRKQHTRSVLKDIYDQAEQLIVLAHDAHFLKDMRDDLYKVDRQLIALLRLRHSSQDYSDFADIDLDRECASTYYLNYGLLSDFVAGKPEVETRSVAKAIRPFLEGYLHRRFPGVVPRELMFGQIVAAIRDSDMASPLSCALNLVEELDGINTYAGRFHHDTNPGNADSATVTHSELGLFVRRALHVVHQGSALV